MSAAELVYWASAALMWAITIPACLWMRHWRLLLKAATTDLRGKQLEHQLDAPLAEWCRHMSLTVVTVTGSVYSTTFAELQASEVPNIRNWNVPIQVTVWSDLEDDLPPMNIKSIGDPFPGFPREEQHG